MPTEVEIKEEMLKAVKDSGQGVIDRIEEEINTFASKDGLDGKSILQKFYSQWKSKKTGRRNVHNSWAAYYLGITTAKPAEEFECKVRRAFARPSPPDIDTDFEYFRRDEVMDHIIK